MSDKHPVKVRSLFISDLHLGWSYSRSVKVTEALKNYDAEYLYLVGDIIDGWKFRKGMAWDDSCSFVIRKIIGMLKHGTQVFYAVGNHDEFLKEYAPIRLGHITIDEEFIHTTADGKRFLIVHGDCFDTLTRHLTWAYRLGDWAYDLLLYCNKLLNMCRRRLGLKYWSLSALLKAKVKQAVNFVNDFEHFVVKYTKQKECSGVVCGHIHTPVIKELDGITYHNCGDWIEHCTLLVEHLDGRMELVSYEVHE